MKKTLLLLVTIFSIPAISQTNLESIKKENSQLKDENNFLKKKLEFCTGISDSIVTIKSFSSDYDIKILSCKGNKSSQSVEITLILSHQIVNQQFNFNLKESRAIDNIGNGYLLSIPNFDWSIGSYDIFTDTPFKITYIVKNVLPGTEMFKMVALQMNSDVIGKHSYANLLTEIKNLKIVW